MKIQDAAGMVLGDLRRAPEGAEAFGGFEISAIVALISSIIEACGAKNRDAGALRGSLASPNFFERLAVRRAFVKRYGLSGPSGDRPGMFVESFFRTGKKLSVEQIRGILESA